MILKGIALGIGVILGFMLVVMVIALLYLLVFILYKYSMQRDFTLDLFQIYQEELLKQERFEEIGEINQIINGFQNKQIPRDLLQKYKVDVDTYLYWKPTYEGGERLVFKHDKRIMKKASKK
jgi:hypothetical protein